jgi:hypothetical protein
MDMMAPYEKDEREEIMNAKHNLSGVAAALLVFSSVALAQDEGPQYTLSSLCGDYGAVVTYGANVAARLRA